MEWKAPNLLKPELVSYLKSLIHLQSKLIIDRSSYDLLWSMLVVCCLDFATYLWILVIEYLK